MDASKKLHVSNAWKTFTGLVQCFPPSNDFTIWMKPGAEVVALNPKLEREHVRERFPGDSSVSSQTRDRFRPAGFQRTPPIWPSGLNWRARSLRT